LLTPVPEAARAPSNVAATTSRPRFRLMSQPVLPAWWCVQGADGVCVCVCGGGGRPGAARRPSTCRAQHHRLCSPERVCALCVVPEDHELAEGPTAPSPAVVSEPAL
jgi:hypothetical protein